MVCLRTEPKSLFDDYPIHLTQAFIYLHITFSEAPNSPYAANDPRKLIINTDGYWSPYSKRSMPDLDPITRPTTNAHTNALLPSIVKERYIDDTIREEEHRTAHWTAG